MLENNEIKIIECKYGEREDIIKFLINITSKEFGYTDWKEYFEHKLVEKYKTGKNNFWVVLNKDNKIIGTCGALQQTENVIKMNCFYIDSKYRNLGIGKRLYNLFIEFAKKEDYKEIILFTYKKFDRAIRFYEERGFKLYEVVEDELWYKTEL